MRRRRSQPLQLNAHYGYQLSYCSLLQRTPESIQCKSNSESKPCRLYNAVLVDAPKENIAAMGLKSSFICIHSILKTRSSSKQYLRRGTNSNLRDHPVSETCGSRRQVIQLNVALTHLFLLLRLQPPLILKFIWQILICRLSRPVVDVKKSVRPSV